MFPSKYIRQMKSMIMNILNLEFYNSKKAKDDIY